jgi:hypothetical protein
VRRTLVLVLGAVTALAVFASPALAIQSVQKFSASVSPSKAGTKQKPRAISLQANPYFDTNAPDLGREVQFATVNANVFFPKDGITNAKYFPSCAPSTVFQDESQCPRGSLVGTAKGFGKGLGLDEEVVGKFFNLPGGKGATLLVTGESPLIIREIVPATLTKLSGDPLYSYRLSFSVPRNLQSPAPGVIASVMRFASKIPVQSITRNGKKLPYMASTGCTGGKWHFKYTADYTTTFDSAIESSQTVETTQNCTK